MSENMAATEGSSYGIRQYRPQDREDFLSLFEMIYGAGSEEWFEWKYVRNPYFDEIPIFLAEHDGEIVGARPYFAYRMRVDDGSVIAFQTANTIVHPDHRRQGLFTKMTEQSIDYYADRGPLFTFNVPNALSRPGYFKIGCERVSDLTTYYRVQNPSTFADSLGMFGTLARMSEPFARVYMDVKDARAELPSNVSVTRDDSIPVEILLALYQRHPPGAIHANRDAEYFSYRFDNPQWEYLTYIAWRGDDPIAAIITGTREKDHVTTNLTDVLPLVGSTERDQGIIRILARILEDHGNADLIASRGPSIPYSILRQFGFYSDQSLPLTLASSPTVLITCPLPTDGSWKIRGRDLRDSSNWYPTFAEQEWT